MFLTRRIGFKHASAFSRANMSSSKGNLDPRTETFKKLVTPWELWDESKQYKSFQLFNFSKMTSSGILKMLQTPIDLRPEKISSWWERRLNANIIDQQSFRVDRHESLGGDISAGHALISIGAKILYRGKPWITKNPRSRTSTLQLPSKFEEGWIMEAIDVSDCPLHYEGLLNVHRLNNVHSLFAKNCLFFDNWCLDHISSELLGLKKLDLSGCERLTPSGLPALIRLPNLQSLSLSHIPAIQTKEGVLACILLKECNPLLEIEGVDTELVMHQSSEDTVTLEKELTSTSA